MTSSFSEGFDLYVASCERDGGIYRYRIREEARLLDYTPMDRPMYMALSNGKLYVLLRDPFGNGESGLAECVLDGTGRVLPPCSLRSTRGAVACHLAVHGERVYGVNYVSGSVIAMPEKRVLHRGNSIHGERQASPHPHFISPTPDGEALAVTDLGLDRILIYDKDLDPLSEVSLPAGHGPRHLAFHGDGRHVFCANELASTVSVLQYEKGKMTLLQTCSVLPEDFHGESTAAAIRCVGDRVFVSNRGHDSVSLLDFSEGALTLRKTLSAFGSCPRDFLVREDRLFIANEHSHELAILSARDGALLGKISVPSPVCLVGR